MFAPSMAVRLGMEKQRKYIGSLTCTFLVAAALVGCSDGTSAEVPPAADSGADATFEAAPPCPAGQELCGSVCATIASDPKNCGACGKACGTGEVCAAGTCAVQCPTGQTLCGGKCVSVETDRGNCGACGTACAEGEVCSASKCATSCATGFLTCESGGDAGADSGLARYCANPKKDRENCGVCGKTCASGEVCKDGTCALDCAAGQTACSDGKCHDLQNDNAHCGACGTACAAGQVCSAGACALTCASGLLTCTASSGDAGVDGGDAGSTMYCANSKTDRENCGACGTKCADGQVCSDGTCAVSCVAGLTKCGTSCRDLQSDNTNCGACGTTCGAGTACSMGACKPTCATGQIECGGSCIDPKISPAHCGATAGCGVGGIGSAGSACTLEEACVSGTCLTVGLPVTTGLAAHFSARSSTSIVKGTAGEVTSWRDLSGNARDLGVVVAPAVLSSCINGRPCIDFSGGKGLRSSAFPLTTQVTVFVVAQWRVPGNWGPLAHHGSRDNDWSLENNAFKGPNITHFQSVNDNAGVELTVANGTNYVFAGRIAGTTRYYSTTSTVGGTATVTGTGNSIAAGSKILYVGRSEINEASNAYIGEIVYYDRPLSDVERDKVIAYLRTLWGI